MRRTKNQEMILKAIQNKQITVLHGCAGTGKTAMAIAMALKLLEYNRFDKIVVVRPMILICHYLTKHERILQLFSFYSLIKLIT